MVLLEMIFNFCKKCNAMKIHEVWIDPNTGRKEIICIACEKLSR